MLLAFAMLTHHRLGTQACDHALDDNLVRMVLDLGLPHWPSFSMQELPKDTWDLLALFHTMAKTDYRQLRRPGRPRELLLRAR
jgi:hypothetical protein